MRPALRTDRRDDQLLAFLLFGVGGLRVAIAIARGEHWAAEATIALLMVILGIAVVRDR